MTSRPTSPKLSGLWTHACLSPRTSSSPNPQPLTLMSLGQLLPAFFIGELSSCHPEVQVPHGSAALVHRSRRGLLPWFVLVWILWDGRNIIVSHQARQIQALSLSKTSIFDQLPCCAHETSVCALTSLSPTVSVPTATLYLIATF